jgi:hypothetical protein
MNFFLCHIEHLRPWLLISLKKKKKKKKKKNLRLFFQIFISNELENQLVKDDSEILSEAF